MPAAVRASAVIRPCVVEAGWVIVLLVSPRFAVIEMSRVASTTRQAAASPPRTSNETIAPPALLLPSRERVLRMRAQPRIVDALDLRMPLEPARELERPRGLRLHAHLQRLEPLDEHPRVERPRGSVPRCEGNRGRRRRMSSRRPSTAPPSTRPWPSRYFVAEWMMRSAPSFEAAAAAPACRSSCPPRAAHPRACATSASAAMSDDLGQRVRRCLEEQKSVVRPHRARATRRRRCRRRRSSRRRTSRRIVVEELHRGAEDPARGDDVVARLHESHAAREDRGHPGSGRHAGLRTLQGREPLLEGGDGRDW